MQREKGIGTKMGSIDVQMFVVRDFMEELYNKTLFLGGKSLNTELTPSQIKSIFAFEEEDQEYPIGILGKNAQVKRSAITNMVDYLEKEGIAERCKDDGDRRVVKVRLTEKGRRIRKEFIQRRRDEVAKIFGKLKGADKKALIYHLGEALHILQKI